MLYEADNAATEQNGSAVSVDNNNDNRTNIQISNARETTKCLDDSTTKLKQVVNFERRSPQMTCEYKDETILIKNRNQNAVTVINKAEYFNIYHSRVNSANDKWVFFLYLPEQMLYRKYAL